MTPAETGRLLGHIARRWPHAPLPIDSGDVWLADLAEIPAAEALAAVTRWARAGEQFPPTSGWVRSDVDRQAQTAAPSFDELQAFLSRHASLLPYGERNRPEDTPHAVARLAVAGAHEAVAQVGRRARRVRGPVRS
jgi:hypothetical protein